MSADLFRSRVKKILFPVSKSIVAAALVLIFSVGAAAQVKWSRTYGGSYSDEFSIVIPTSDGGFAAAGQTYSFGVMYGGVWVVRTNSTGSLMWQNTYSSSSGASVATSMIQTSDGGFAVAGFTYASGQGISDVWVLKLNAAGLIAWQKTYGGTGGESGYSIWQTSDGGYIVAADTDSFGAGNIDFMLLKLTSSGNLLWQKTYGTSGNDESPASVQQTSDGGYIVAGYSGMLGRGEAFASGPTDFWVLKLEVNGGISWQKFYGGSSEEFANDIQQTSDGGYIVAGYSSSFSGGYNYDCWIVKLDSSGGVDWQKAYGGTGDDYAQSVRQTSDGGYIVAGKSASIGAMDGDCWVIKLDPTGAIVWQKGYSGAGDDEANSVRQTSDGGYIIGGNSFSPQSYNSDAWVLRTDPNGEIDPSCSFIYATSLNSVNTSGSAPSSSGTASASGAVAADSAVSPVTSSATVVLQCAGMCPTIVLSPASLPGASSGAVYSQQITATGGTSPYTFSALASSLPPGMTFTEDGLLSGTPTSTGSYPITVHAYDYNECEGTADYTLVVSGSCGTIALSPSTLPSAVPGTYYNQTITASGGSSPYEFSVTAGGLPPGLSLDKGGTISGTPTETGSYNFTVTATDSSFCTGSQEYTLSAGCAGTTGTLRGYVALSQEGGEVFYPLDGPGVTGFVTATGPDGSKSTAQLSGGGFDFGAVPYGQYSLVATINYTDHIPYDASLLAVGCPSPRNGTVLKEVSSVPRAVDVMCDQETYTVVDFEGPIVMLHGMYGCYEKWYSGDTADPEYYNYWDNYARGQSVISFTPNYEWWGDSGSWLTRTDEVIDQITQDMNGLTSEGVVPYILVAHDMGGLIVRILGSPLYADDPVTEEITSAYIIGTPNSGTDFNLRSGKGGLLGPNSIIRYFNDVYPDFGEIDVYAIAGNRGWWGTDNNDGRVSLYSAFNVTRVACKGDDCVAYPALTLESGFDHVFEYRHRELGSPESVQSIFEDVILLTGRAMSVHREDAVPEAPVGGVEWGTVGRSSATMGTNTNSARIEEAQDYPFTVSKCDGMAVFVTVTSGSGSFKVIDPSGFAYDLEDYTFVKTAPETGTWNLRAIPGASGMTFQASAIDNSIFGIKAYLTNEYVAGNEKTTIRADRDGDWSLVTPGLVQAMIFDSAGSIVSTIALQDNGSYFSNEFGAPAAPGTYQIAVRAEGTYGGSAFTRMEFETLNVLPAAHVFTGAFSDAPADEDGDGRYDAVSFTAGISSLQSGYYIVSGDLFDSAGNFLSHSSAAVGQGGQVSLLFPLMGLSCSQLSSPLEVTGLKLLDADSLRAVDVWGSPVATQSFSSGQFNCDATAPAPKVISIIPTRVVAGTVANIAVVGRNFDEDALVLFDAGIGQQISVLKTEPFENRVVFTSVSIPASAVGHCNVTVRNPDGKEGTLYEILVSAEDSAPRLSLDGVDNGSVVGGVVDVVANAADDVRVASVSFELDGALQSTSASFPFIWKWDTSVSSVGTHTVRATATDSAGHQTAIQSTVSVVQPPVVASMSRKGNPFRIIASGSNFQPGLQVFINGELWTNSAWKSTGKVVLKGGKALKMKVPKGIPTAFRFVNGDGGEQTVIWQW